MYGLNHKKLNIFLTFYLKIALNFVCIYTLICAHIIAKQIITFNVEFYKNSCLINAMEKGGQ